MKQTFQSRILGLALLLALPAAAGTLYGTVRQKGAGPARGVVISVACPTFDNPSTRSTARETDEDGSYAVHVKMTGRCEMRVSRNRKNGRSFIVLVSDRPLQFDFLIDDKLDLVP